jgi:hypothetical protein
LSVAVHHEHRNDALEYGQVDLSDEERGVLGTLAQRRYPDGSGLLTPITVLRASETSSRGSAGPRLLG